jgi:hypothetical protein
MSPFHKEVVRLTPLMREAEEAHSDFKAHWKMGVGSMGWEDFKKTEVYDRKLQTFWDAQRRLEKAEGPILESVRAGSCEGVWSALAYLSVRQRPFRSGYMTQRLVRALKKVSLGEEERRILRGILLDRLTWPWSQPRELWGLITRIRTQELDTEIRQLAQDDRGHVHRRARAVVSRYGLGKQ